MSVLTIAALKALWIDGFIPDGDDYVDLFDTIEANGGASIYTADGTIPADAERAVTLGENASLVIGDALFIGAGMSGVSFSVDAGEFGISAGSSGINAMDGSSLEIIGMDGLQIRTGDGTNIIPSVVGQTLVAVGTNGEMILKTLGALNGLTKVGDNTKLGGSLTEETFINTNTQTLRIGKEIAGEESAEFHNGVEIDDAANSVKVVRNHNDGLKVVGDTVSLERQNRGVKIESNTITIDTSITTPAGAKSVDFVTDKLRVRKSNGAVSYAVLDFQSSGMAAGDQTFLFPTTGGRLALDGNAVNNISSNSEQAVTGGFLGQFVVLTPSSGNDSDVVLMPDLNAPNWNIGGSCKVMFRGTGACTFSPFNGNATILTPVGFTLGENEVANIIKIAADTYSVSK